MNGATEQTLAELLATAQAMNVNLVKLNGLVGKMNTSGGGGSSGGGSSSSSGPSNPASMAGSALSSLGEAAGSVGGLIGKVLGGAISLVAGAFGVLGSVISSTISTVIDLGKSLIAFTKMAMDGTARLSDFYNAFSSLPLGFGTLFSIVSQVVSISEKLLDTYRELTKSGAAFSGNLFEMQREAARAHLSLVDFAQVVSKNSEIFATMGGNVQSGISRFTDSMNKLMDVNGPYAKKLLAMGMTAQDAGNALASYMKNQGTMNKQELANADLVSQGVVDYALQLDTLSKITGKRREQIQQEYDEVADEQSFQAYLASLPAAQADAVRAAVTEATQAGGKELGNQMKLSAQGITVARTDAQKALAAATGGESLRATENIANAIKQGKDQKEIATISRNNLLGVYNEQKKFYDQMGKETRAVLSANGNAIVRAGDPIDRWGQKVSKLSEAELKAADQQRAQAQGNAKELAIAEQRVKEFGNQMTILWSKILEPIMPYATQFANWIIKMANEHMPDLAKGAKWVADTLVDMFTWVKNYYNELVGVYKSSGGWTEVFKKIWNDATKALGELWDKVWPVVKPKLEQAFKDLSDYLKPLWDKLMNDISIRIKDWIGDNTIFGEASKDRKERESNLTSDDYKLWEKSNQSQKRILGLFGYYEASQKELYNQYKAQIELGDWTPGSSPTPTKEVSPQQRRASGGLVNPGSYLVGEQGPEIANVGMSGDVISNDNLTALLKNSNNNNVVAALERLNNTQLQLLSAMHLNNNITDKQVRATVALGNDLFA
jgi:hypothetical protein